MSKEEVISKIGEKALGYLESAELFAKTEIPEYLKEILRYNMVIGTLEILFVVLLCLLPICLLKIKNNFKLSDEAREGCNIFIGFMVIVLMISIPTVLFTGVNRCVKVGVAPRVFLVDYFRELR